MKIIRNTYLSSWQIWMKYPKHQQKNFISELYELINTDILKIERMK